MAANKTNTQAAYPLKENQQAQLVINLTYRFYWELRDFFVLIAHCTLPFDWGKQGYSWLACFQNI